MLTQAGRERLGITAQRKPEFDLDDRPRRPGPDGRHSFGVRQRHPEVGFDIIPDQQAGLGESIVRHGYRLEQGGSMRRRAGIVAETRHVRAWARSMGGRNRVA